MLRVCRHTRKTDVDDEMVSGLSVKFVDGVGDSIRVRSTILSGSGGRPLFSALLWPHEGIAFTSQTGRKRTQEGLFL